MKGDVDECNDTVHLTTARYYKHCARVFKGGVVVRGPPGTYYKHDTSVGYPVHNPSMPLPPHSHNLY